MSYKPYLSQEYEKIKRQCLASGKDFVDDKFPPNESSISKLKKQKKDYQVTWRRPHEIIENPQFIVNGINPNDLAQGDTGDCWFISAASSLAYIPQYFKRVIPENQSFNSGDYAGIFHFRFWQFGEWLDVVVDDLLPIDEEGQLIYCHNRVDKNEFFGPLLEKAYAKLAGCYEFLDGGNPGDAMTDLTGAICETFNLVKCAELTNDYDDEDEDDENDDYDDEETDEDNDEDYDDDDDESDEEDEETNENCTDLETLWTFINKSLKMNSMMNAAFDDPEQKGSIEELQENALYAGHAYSVMQAAEIKYKTRGNKSRKVRLLKLRNPHGVEKPWKGQWSIRSRSWKNLDSKTKQRFKLSLDNYGEFYMSFDDFVKNFQELVVAHVNLSAYFDPDEEFSNDSQEWMEVKFFGEWKSGKNSGCEEGYWKNAQYLIKVNEGSKDVCPVLVSLMQPYEVKLRMENVDYEQTKISVYEVDAGESEIKERIAAKARFNEDELNLIDSTGAYFNNREMAKRFNLEPGYYVVIPSNYDRKNSSRYLLRFFHDKKSTRVFELKN